MPSRKSGVESICRVLHEQGLAVAPRTYRARTTRRPAARTVTAMAGIPAQHAGMASGFLMTGHEVGAALGVAVLSAVATGAGSLTDPAGVVAGFSAAFVVAAVLAVLVGIVAWLRMPAARMTGSAAMHMH